MVIYEEGFIYSRVIYYQKIITGYIIVEQKVKFVMNL